MGSKALKVIYLADDKSVQAALSRLQKGHVRFGKRLKHFGKEMRHFGHRMTRLITLPVIAAGLASAKLATDFEESMDKIESLVGVSHHAVQEFAEGVKKMAPAVGKTPRELADALFFITSAGFRGAKALSVLRASAKASAAGLGETKVVADAVTSAVNAYGIKMLKPAKATDVLIAAVREGKMPVEDLAGAIGTVLGPASEVGVEFAEVAGTAAALSRVGGNVKRTMTGLRFLLTSLVKPTSASAKVLKDAGISTDELRKSVKEKGLLPTLRKLKDSLSLPDFLTVVGGARGVVTALGLVGKNAKQARTVMNNVAKAGGSTNRAFEVASKTMKFKMGQAMASLQVAGIKVGNILLPKLKQVAEWIAKMADKFSKASPKTQKMIMLIAGLAAVLGPVIVILGTLVTAIGALISPVGAVILGIIAIIAIFKMWNRIPGWVRIVIQVIFPMIAIAKFLVKNWRKVGSTMADVWRNIKAVFGDAIGFILQGIRLFLGVFLGMVGAVIHGAAAAFGWVPGIGGKLKRARDNFDKFKNGILEGLDKQIARFHDWGKEIVGAMSAVQTAAANTSYVIKGIGPGMAGRKVQVRARGGRVSRGQPYIVGEHRPELFVPGEDGAIIPRVPGAAKLGASRGAMGGFPDRVKLVVDGKEFTAFVRQEAAGEIDDARRHDGRMGGMRRAS